MLTFSYFFTLFCETKLFYGIASFSFKLLFHFSSWLQAPLGLSHETQVLRLLGAESDQLPLHQLARIPRHDRQVESRAVWSSGTDGRGLEEVSRGERRGLGWGGNELRLRTTPLFKLIYPSERLSCCLMFRAYSSTSTPALCSLAGETPLSV